MIHILHAFLLGLLAGTIFVAFASWLVFCGWLMQEKDWDPGVTFSMALGFPIALVVFVVSLVVSNV